MKTKLSRIAVLVGLGLASASFSAAAVTWTYTANNLSNTQGAVTGAFSGYYSPDIGTTKLISDTPDTYGTNGVGNCTPSPADPNCSAVPQHALDNQGAIESLLLSFNKSVMLSQVSLGYARELTSATYNSSTMEQISGANYFKKADFTVLAYTGSSTTVATDLNNLKYNQLLSNGWSLIGNYGDVASGGTAALNNTTTSSSYWLIAAYNSVFGSCGTCTDAGSASALGSSDFLKVSSVGGTPTNKTPEPSSIALLGIGLLGALTLRRRQKSDTN